MGRAQAILHFVSVAPPHLAIELNWTGFQQEDRHAIWKDPGGMHNGSVMWSEVAKQSNQTVKSTAAWQIASIAADAAAAAAAAAKDDGRRLFKTVSIDTLRSSHNIYMGPC